MSSVKRLLILPLAALVFVLGSIAVFYSGWYVAPQTPLPAVENLTLPSYSSPPFLETPERRRGTLLVDMLHFNSIGEQELNVLLSRVSARGYTIQLLGSRSFLGADERESLLENGLRSAHALAVAMPFFEFTPRERVLVRDFVERGGKLLLLGDVIRQHSLNSLVPDFGLIFEDDYLYNVKEHESNYRNIFLRDFQPGSLTQGLRSVVFYTAGSIRAEGLGIVFTDDNTFSSKREEPGRLAVVALAAKDRVLAISDVTFMTAPYNNVQDNDRFISNIADFLTTSERVFRLREFPHFFGPEVDVVMGNDRLIKSAQSLLSLLSAPERRAEVQSRESFLRDTVFLGLWEDASRVEQYLTSAGIQVGKTIHTPFTPDTRREGIALVYLYESQGRHLLIILGDSPDTVKEVVARLESGDFREGLVSDMLGVYRISEAPTSTSQPLRGERGQ